jgi:hypothetical protein
MALSTRSFLASALLLALTAAACTADPAVEGEGGDGTLGSVESAAVASPGGFTLQPIVIADPPVKPQSFVAATTWANELTVGQGWTGTYPRTLADLDGDGKKDVVGFGIDGVWRGRSLGSSFEVRFVLADFGQQSAWTSARHERLVGDITGDGRDDIVGFGNAGVYISTSTPTGFGPVQFVIADFGYDSGWRVESHERLLADVDGDGKKDIVAYGNAGVWIARSTGTGFAPPSYVLARFGTSAGFTKTRHIRTAADVNGDRRDDLVVFADDGVYTALSTGSGFATPTRAVAGLGYTDGWRVDRHPRMLVDVNRDGRKDIIGFGDAGMYVARSNANGFGAATFEVPFFGVNQGFTSQTRNPRFLGDLNGDGYVDVFGAGPSAVSRSLGGPTGFAAKVDVLNDFSPVDSYGSTSTPVMAGDVDGDGKTDLVGFGQTVIEVARSTDVAPPAPPTSPSDLRATVGSGSATLTWTDRSTDEIRFHITRKKAGDAQASDSYVGANVTTYSISGLTASTQYCFNVQAQSAFNGSAFTQQVCVTTPAAGGGGGGGGGSEPVSETRCGVGNAACRAGYHAEAYIYSTSCAGNGSQDNATTCVTNTNNLGTFTACDIMSCPSGFHPVGFVHLLQCDRGGNTAGDDSATTCQADTTAFQACGGCPAGYTATQVASSTNCSPYLTYRCTKP